MNAKPVIISGVIAVLFIASVYFVSKYVLERGRLDYTSITSQEKPTTHVVKQKPGPTTKGRGIVTIPVPLIDKTSTNRQLNDEQETSVTQQPAPAMDTERNIEVPNTAETSVIKDEPVSPYGFGPYPEVPSDFPNDVIWSEARKTFRTRISNRQRRNFELADRVLIKLWNQGHRAGSAIISLDGSRMYPLYPKTVYVRWKTFVEDDGTVSRYSSHTTAHYSVPDVDLDQIEEGIIPPGYNVLSRDENYINPFEFLNLK